jgi:hypothetical protein
MSALKVMQRSRRWLSAGMDALALAGIASLLSACAGDTCHPGVSRGRPGSVSRRAGNRLAKVA